MKIMPEIDEELYREASSCMIDQRMRDLVTEDLHLALQAGEKAAKRSASSRKLAACFAEADKLMKAAPRVPSARSI